ncbi:MAG: heavy-metal-associated domain-containing protein [Ruminococcaceae bacterium]|nr:heavy-metal-associated domain-containing protein [Oscillospiraceae bacterium]MBQ8897007.1 cation transporter [Clostridia bacterium]
MKKTFALEELDCANCARKMEDGIRKIPGVNAVTVNFFAQKLILDAEDSRFDEILAAAEKAISKVDRNCTVVK